MKTNASNCQMFQVNLPPELEDLAKSICERIMVGAPADSRSINLDELRLMVGVLNKFHLTQTSITKLLASGSFLALDKLILECRKLSWERIMDSFKILPEQAILLTKYLRKPYTIRLIVESVLSEIYFKDKDMGEGNDSSDRDDLSRFVLAYN